MASCFSHQVCVQINVVTLVNHRELFQPTAATSSTELEDWTSALRGIDKGKVEQLLQPLRDIGNVSLEKGKKLLKLLQPLAEKLPDLIVIPDKLDRESAITLLEDFAVKYQELVPDDQVWKGLRWLELRCTDTTSPVTGDARVQLDAAYEAFREQLDNVSNVEYTAGFLLTKLKELRGQEDPEVIKAIRLLGVHFFAALGGGTSPPAIESIGSIIDEFVKIWSKKL